MPLKMKNSSPLRMKNRDNSFRAVPVGYEKKKNLHDNPEKKFPWMNLDPAPKTKRPPAVYTNVQSREQSLDNYLNGK